MLIWLIFAGILAAVLAAVLRPLMRHADGPAETSGFDRAVYRDQLREIDADLERGLVSKADAESARVEVSRRLLAAGDSDTPIAAPAWWIPLGGQPLAYGIGGAVLLLTLGLYGFGGSPGLPGQPFQQRAKAPVADQRIGELIAQVEERLRLRPDDGAGWDVLAPVYLRLQRYEEAAEAYTRAIQLLGETPKRLASLGEALVASGNGIVSEPARAVFEKLLKAEPGRPDARFWLAMAKEQDGKLVEAASDYRAMLAEAPPDATWRGAVEKRLNQLGAKPEPTTVAPIAGTKPAPGPSASDVAAAEKMSAEDRGRMITGMVEGLAQKLKREPRDIEGWLRLIRAYSVLGRREDAVAALKDAKKNLGSEAAALQSIDALAKELGLDT